MSEYLEASERMRVTNLERQVRLAEHQAWVAANPQEGRLNIDCPTWRPYTDACDAAQKAHDEWHPLFKTGWPATQGFEREPRCSFCRTFYTSGEERDGDRCARTTSDGQCPGHIEWKP